MEEMHDVMVRLNKERLDLHIHCVCDGTLRLLLDAPRPASSRAGDSFRRWI